MHDDPRRTAPADLHVLPPGARARGARRADAADGRRAHDARDRAGVPGAGADRRPAARCARSARSATPGSRTACRRASSCRNASTACSPFCYLVFNEGYASTEGELVRAELCEEAIWLARVVDRLLPGEPRVRGLLALMLLQHSRRAARTDAAGDLVLLEDQDRARWDHAMIDEGLASWTRDRPRGARAVPLQAAIAALHARAPRPEDTDWPADRGPLRALRRSEPVAGGRAQPRRSPSRWPTGPTPGCGSSSRSPSDLDRYHLFHAARADLLRRSGGPTEAAEAYGRALDAGDRTSRAPVPASAG